MAELPGPRTTSLEANITALHQQAVERAREEFEHHLEAYRRIDTKGAQVVAASIALLGGLVAFARSAAELDPTFLVRLLLGFALAVLGPAILFGLNSYFVSTRPAPPSSKVQRSLLRIATQRARDDPDQADIHIRAYATECSNLWAQATDELKSVLPRKAHRLSLAQTWIQAALVPGVLAVLLVVGGHGVD